MRVMAIDPGYERLGVAIMERGRTQQKVIYSACFTTPKEDPLYTRLGLIAQEIKRLIDLFSPNILAIETLFFNTNQKTALAVAEARGTIVSQSVLKGLRVCEYSPLQVKSAVVGYGRGDKKQVIDMVKRLSDVSENKRMDDEYDAIAVGLTCFASEKPQHNL